MAELAFLGLGRMGSGMACRLAEAGHNVRVWNRTKNRAAEALAAGAVWAEDPAVAARGKHAVFTMLADDAAANVVWDAALPAMAPGSFAIECSTVSAPHVAAMAANAASRGIRYVDSPVTGWPNQARDGTLTLLVGAQTADLEALAPVLAPLAATIRHFGPVGTGTAYKLMVNLMGAVQIAALAEGLALAAHLGLDAKTVGDALAAGAAASPQVVANIARMLEADSALPPQFTTALRHKDAAYGLALAQQAGIAAPLGAAATAWFDAAKKLDPAADQSIVIKAVQDASTPRGAPPPLNAL
jgi:3-hydroxyisobutyrate dehydrogenase